MLSFKGITIHKPTGLFRVVAKVNGVWIHYGLYPSLKVARGIYWKASGGKPTGRRRD